MAQLPQTREVLEQHVFRAMCQTAVRHRSRLPKALPCSPTGEGAGQSEKTDPLRPNCSRKPSSELHRSDGSKTPVACRCVTEESVDE